MTSDLNHIRTQLADYLANRLPENEHQRIRQALEQHPELLEEIQFEKDLAAYYQELPRDLPEPSPELFSRVQQNIVESETAQAETAKSSPPVSPTWAERLVACLRLPSFAWGVAAVQCLLLIILLSPSGPKSGGTTLSGSISGTDRPAQINLIFQDNARQGEIRLLLQETAAEIVGGPTTEGLYQLRIAKDHNLDQALNYLRESPLVKFAGPRY